MSRLRGLISDDTAALHPIFTSRLERPLTVLGRLKPNVTIDQAQAEMNLLTRRLEDQYPATDKGTGARVAFQAALFS